MKSHFVQVKGILKFNLADGLEHIMELINEKVKKKNKKSSQEKKKEEEITFFLMCSEKQDAFFFPLIKALTSVLGLRVRGTSRTKMNSWLFLSSESFYLSPIFRSHLKEASSQSH